MGLYDNFRQANTQAVSKFVGSIVPEVKEISKTVQDRYNAAADSDDQLQEALGNLQHIKDDGDEAYANELKTKYYDKLQERSQRDDYENMGRKTKRDAMRFAQDYMPLVQRQKDLTELNKGIDDDKDIFTEETKAELKTYLMHMNAAQKDENGEYIRDPSGKIKLGSIQNIPYSKDVNVTERLSKFMKDVEVKVTQGGWYSDGKGLKISSITEMKSPEKLAQLAASFVKYDQEIAAMDARNVKLKTYKLSAADYKAVADKNNVSEYDLLRRGHSADEIAVAAKHAGKTIAELKTSKVQEYRAEAKANGQSETAGDMAFYKQSLKDQMNNGRINMLAHSYNVDNLRLSAMNDSDYDRQADYNLNNANQLFFTQSAQFSLSDNRNPEDIQKSIDGGTAVLNEATNELKAAVGNVLGLDPLNSKMTKQQRQNQISSVNGMINNPSKVKAVIARLNAGTEKQQETAAKLEQLLQKRTEGMEQLSYLKSQNQPRIPGTTASQGFTIVSSKDSKSLAAQAIEQMNVAVQNQSIQGTVLGSNKNLGDLIKEKLGGKHWYGDNTGTEDYQRKLKGVTVDMTTTVIEGNTVALLNIPGNTPIAFTYKGLPKSITNAIHITNVRAAGSSSSVNYGREQANTSLLALGQGKMTDATIMSMNMTAPSTTWQSMGDGKFYKKIVNGKLLLYQLGYGNDANHVTKSGKPRTNPTDLVIELGKEVYNLDKGNAE